MGWAALESTHADDLPAGAGRAAARDAGRPLVTFYDDATGERTELSVTTYANWVAKVASLLVEELELEHGDRVLVDLPAHWLGAGGAGSRVGGGLEVVWRATTPTPSSPGRTGWTGGPARPARPGGGERAAARWAGRFAGPLPAGVHDLGVEVWSQPDAYVRVGRPPADDDRRCRGVTQAELWGAAAAGSSLTDGGRLLSEANPASPSGLASFIEPLARSGSMVLVAPRGRRDASGRGRRARHARA